MSVPILEIVDLHAAYGRIEVLRGVTLGDLFNPDGSLSHPSALLSLPLLSPATAPRPVETPLA